MVGRHAYIPKLFFAIALVIFLAIVTAASHSPQHRRFRHNKHTNQRYHQSTLPPQTLPAVDEEKHEETEPLIEIDTEEPLPWPSPVTEPSPATTKPLPETEAPVPPVNSSVEQTCIATAVLPCAYAGTQSGQMKDLMTNGTRRRPLQNTTMPVPWWGKAKRSNSTIEAVKALKKQVCSEHIDETFQKTKQRRDTQTTMSTCHSRNTLSSPGSHRICGECSAITDLGPSFSPRYVNEIICNESEGATCFGGEGACVQDSIAILVEKFQFDGSSAYIPYYMRIGCVCELFPQSVMLLLNAGA